MSVLVVRVIPFFFFIWADKSVIPIVPLQKKKKKKKKKNLRDILSKPYVVKKGHDRVKGFKAWVHCTSYRDWN